MCCECKVRDIIKGIILLIVFLLFIVLIIVCTNCKDTSFQPNILVAVAEQRR